MAQLLPNGNQQFIDANGNPLVGGLVYFYIPNTTTAKDTWQDAAQTTLNANPVVCDSRGQATIFGSGDYRQILKDSVGNSIWDKTVSSFASTANLQSGASTYAVDTGTANTIIAALSPAPAALYDGMPVRAKVAVTNTGATTINLNGFGALPVNGLAGSALQGGELIAGSVALFMVVPGLASCVLLGCEGGALPITPGTKSNHAVNFGQCFGVGQTWQNVNGSRTFGVNNTNSTGKLIKSRLSVRANATGTFGFVSTIDGVATSYFIEETIGSGNAVLTASVDIPAGSTYQFGGSANLTVLSWYEFRT
jgi:hypothetical protein